MFRTDDRFGLGTLYAPAALVVHGGRAGSPHTRCEPFWPGPGSIFGPLDVTTLKSKVHIRLPCRPLLPLAALMLAAMSAPRGLDTPPKRAGYVVGVLRTARYLAALPRRVLAGGGAPGRAAKRRVTIICATSCRKSTV